MRSTLRCSGILSATRTVEPNVVYNKELSPMSVVYRRQVLVLSGDQSDASLADRTAISFIHLPLRMSRRQRGENLNFKQIHFPRILAMSKRRLPSSDLSSPLAMVAASVAAMFADLGGGPADHATGSAMHATSSYSSSSSSSSSASYAPLEPPSSASYAPHEHPSSTS